MVKSYSGKRKWLLLIVLILLAVTLTYTISITLKPLYTQADIQPENSNLSIKGEINAIKENQKAEGWSAYHVYRYYLTVNISKIIWIDDNLATLNTDFGRKPEGGLLAVGKNITIGYDYLDESQFTVGQKIECKGFYAYYTDSIESMKLTIAPTINGSYLKTQN